MKTHITILLFSLTTSWLQAHPDHLISSDAPAEASAQLPDIIGHGELRYRVIRNWSKANPDKAPVHNAHAMIEDEKGQLYLVTDHPKNAFLVYEKDGTFVRSFGEGIPGGHGVDLIRLDGVEYLIHVDCGWPVDSEGNQSPTNGAIRIMAKDGTILRTLPSPHDLGHIDEKTRYMPCDVAVTPDNDILVADGYSTDRILHFKPDGTLVRVWGGKKPGKPENLENAHGISIDTSDPAQLKVWVSSRSENKLKAFTIEGKLLETIELPGAFAGQALFHGDKLYTGVCWSKENGVGKRLVNSGFVMILDRESNKVLSAPGGTEPTYQDGVLQPIHQGDPIFKHVHDLYVDSEGDIYVGEWNAGHRYPFKLELIHY
ncbi:MAG: hypothetical protein NWT08_05010 [Akkermansiaceae bacterium]|jgi:hypothetical protein|nr:hypothetical protein [Akkermansiaceae bacterium]MDP4721377.1 hypothetical protein [Akkermansiaceae bacterium]MDP4779402.1 hypothetical protein [Akkermansiaceae bacterium]MDP4846742.1 hypothetical protein [Akkermansiaceae bacterium]MDP4897079.1 hypothetical protein [Akkermansiaceae bacterium]